jgi:hypothetical protein
MNKGSLASNLPGRDAGKIAFFGYVAFAILN